jgi:ABC-2 type transport system permease protein
VHVLFEVIRKEFLQMRRDPKMMRMLLISPIIQIMAFGYAVNTDVKDIPLLLVDLDRTSESRDLAERFLAAGYFRLAGVEDRVDAVDGWLIRGRAQVALVVAAGYGREVARGGTPDVQLIADGTDSSSALVGLGYASEIISTRSRELAAARLQALVAAQAAAAARAAPAAPAASATHPPGRIVADERVWYNPDLLSRWYYLPAILAMILMTMTMMLSAMGIVREKEIGTMETLLVTPVRPWQLLAGKLLPYALVGFIELLPATLLVVGWFHVPLRGSFPLLVGLSMLFVLNTLGIGLLISALVRTQQQSMMFTAFVFMMPQIYLSGLIFPVENMPRVLQWVSRAIPLHWYAIILRGIFLKGLGAGDLWREAGMLALIGGTLFTLAATLFRKRLD